MWEWMYLVSVGWGGSVCLVIESGDGVVVVCSIDRVGLWHGV